MTQAAILHVDLDAFYASVEQMKDPSLRGKPVAVGGGVILAASYEARQFGVRAAMPLRIARELCPWLIVVKGSFGDYSELSDKVFDDVCHRFTPQVEQISIDEAFLDVSGSTHLFGTPGEIGDALRAAVLDETGLAISVGVARTKFLAKVGSRYAKPDGMKVINPDEEIAFLHSLPVDYIWGVGPVTERKLHEIGIATVGELAHANRRVIEQRLGRGSGAHLMALAWNRDPRMVTRHHRARSVGAQSSFGGGGRDPMVRREILADLADRVGSRLRKKSRAARTITVRVRFGDLSSVTRSATLRAPVATTPALLAVATHLADDGVQEAGDRDVNLLGIQSSNLVVSPHLQLELPFEEPLGTDDVAYAGSVAELERHRLDEVMDALHERFGKDAVGRASRLLGGRSSVPDEFRELATRDRSGGSTGQADRMDAASSTSSIVL